ncbi:MAG: hypothetical protein NXI10_00020 [bacterium]|nr:hypothetical protein [bacterium]
MAFTGKEGGQITLEQGADMTSAYRDQNPGKTKGHFMGRDILLEILNQEGCMGIRVYYGIDNNGDKQLVFVGADSNEDDQLDLIADLSMPCPSRCGSSNDLNS